MGAALAYYTVFSLAPLLLIVIAVAGVVFGQDAVRGEIVNQLAGLMGQESASAVQELLKSASSPKEGFISSIVGVALLVVGATTVFAELQSALDRVWRVPAPKKASGLWNLLRTRFLSFGMVLGLGFMMLVSLVVGAALSALGNWYGTVFRGWEVVLYCVNVLVSLAMSTTLFAMIYKFMPRARIAWSDVWIGAVVTAVLFEAGKFIIGVYLGKAGVTSGFGAAGSLVVLIVWVYYSAQIFLLGAEFTWVYARTHGSHSANIATTDAAVMASPPEEKPRGIPSRGADSPVAIAAPATFVAPGQSRKTGVMLVITSVVLVALTGLVATLSAQRERYR
jgi:membrane protein